MAGHVLLLVLSVPEEEHVYELQEADDDDPEHVVAPVVVAVVQVLQEDFAASSW